MRDPKGWLTPLLVVLAIAGVLVWVGEASADGIEIEIKIDETVSPMAVAVDGVNSSRVTVTRAGEVTTVAVSGLTSDPLGAKAHVAVLIEPGPTSTVSDIVLASFSAGTLTVTLTSNTNGTVLTAPPGAVSFQETADFRTVLENEINDVKFEVSVKSGVTEVVPEPATLFLLAAGLVGVGAMWRRQSPMPLDASA